MTYTVKMKRVLDSKKASSEGNLNGLVLRERNYHPLWQQLIGSLGPAENLKHDWKVGTLEGVPIESERRCCALSKYI